MKQVELIPKDEYNHQLVEVGDWSKPIRGIANINGDLSVAKVLSAAYDFLSLAEELENHLAEDAERNSSGEPWLPHIRLHRDQLLSMMRKRMNLAIAKANGENHYPNLVDGSGLAGDVRHRNAEVDEIIALLLDPDGNPKEKTT